MAAGALFRDEDGRVLLVDPTHQPTWDLPAGRCLCRLRAGRWDGESGLDASVGEGVAQDAEHDAGPV